MYGFCTLSTLIAFLGSLSKRLLVLVQTGARVVPDPLVTHSYNGSGNLTRGRVRMDCVGRLRAQVGPGVQGHRHVASQSTIVVQFLHIALLTD